MKTTTVIIHTVHVIICFFVAECDRGMHLTQFIQMFTIVFCEIIFIKVDRWLTCTTKHQSQTITLYLTQTIITLRTFGRLCSLYIRDNDMERVSLANTPMMILSDQSYPNSQRYETKSVTVVYTFSHYPIILAHVERIQDQTQ